jgi:RNA polymerase sigma-70 factor, ECF subfamily
MGGIVGQTLTEADPVIRSERSEIAEMADEASLVAAAKAGDYHAFEELMSRSEMRIHRLLLALTGNPEDAEDLTQEAFLKAFQHLGDFRENSRFHTWLVRIAVNEGLMKLRKRRSDKSAPIEDAVNDEGEVIPREFADWRPNPEQVFEQTELRAILERALQSLPLHYRVVFLLREVQGCSTTEAAEIMKVTMTIAKCRLHRARLRLREHLSKVFRQEEICGFI